jgi:hypothetical protein
MIWKFTDATNTVVYRINDDGSCESHLVEVIADWLSEGNTPDPADPIPETVELTPQEKLASAGLSVDELKELLGIAV